jgi:hypothetical protein
MTRHTTVLAGLLSHLSRSDFEKAVKERQTDKGVRTHMRTVKQNSRSAEGSQTLFRLEFA